MTHDERQEWLMTYVPACLREHRRLEKCGFFVGETGLTVTDTGDLDQTDIVFRRFALKIEQGLLCVGLQSGTPSGCETDYRRFFRWPCEPIDERRAHEKLARQGLSWHQIELLLLKGMPSGGLDFKTAGRRDGGSDE